MTTIRTREVKKGTIKSLDRAAGLADRVRVATVRTKDKSAGSLGKNEESESAYASGRSMEMLEGGARASGRAISGTARKAKEIVNTKRNNVDVKTKKRVVRRNTAWARNNSNAGRGGRRATARGKAAYGKKIKTASRLNASKSITKLKAARQAQTRSVRSIKQAAKSAKKSARLLARALRAAIAGTKALIGALIAGGWIALLIILVCTLFGAALYFFGDESSSNYTAVGSEVEKYTPAIEKYAQVYGIAEYVELIKAVMMQESGGKGKDPMQAAEGAFNKKYPKKPNGIKDPNYSIQCGIQELRAALHSAKVKNPLDMERIRLALQGYNYGNGYIAWAIKRDGGYTVENASVFSDQQAKKHGWKRYGDKQYVAHVLRYYPYGSYNIGVGNTKITQVAAKQIGNNGGRKFWSWYGFKNRVEWCACFVSWCANQCGYIKSGTITKFSSCAVGVEWFKGKKQWQKRSYKPKAGDIIFFDWGGDGHSDHVGIVEKCDGSTVFTIEGNNGDSCKRSRYPANSGEILGYGVPKY